MAHYTRLHHLEHLTLKQFDNLDRERTIVMQPIGMIEVHGEHLPLGTDLIAVDALTAAATAWLLDKDSTIRILLMPTIPYGTDPIDLRRPELFARSGSVWISEETLKSVVGDVVGHMGRYGFRYVFPIGFHGGGHHNKALGEVCDDLRKDYPDSVIAEPVGYVLAGAEVDVSPGLATLLGRPLTPTEQVALQGSVHASMFETSMMLALKPELVDPSYRNLRTIEWSTVYNGEEWVGYIGSGPAHAQPDVGVAVLRWRGVRAASLIYKAVQGIDITTLPRHPAWEPDEITPMQTASPRSPSGTGPLGITAAELKKMRDAFEQQDSDIPDHLRSTLPAGMLDTETLADQNPDDDDDDTEPM